MANKTIVITGASSGIGAALAKLLSREGHNLILSARRIELLKKVAQECGESAIAVQSDVTDRSAVDNLKRQAIAEFGQIDVWINNAGQGISKRILEIDDRDLDEMMLVNLKSALYGIQAVMPHFMERKSGHLINISSFLAKMPMAPQRSAYSAAKAALNSLSETLRFDLGEGYPDIHISVVMPGLVSTDFAKNVYGGPGAALPPQILPPAQSAEDVAKVIADLILSPKNEVFTNPLNAGLLRRVQQEQS